MSYVFRGMRRWGTHAVLADVPSRGDMTLSINERRWRLCARLKQKKCGTFHSFKGKAPNAKSCLKNSAQVILNCVNIFESWRQHILRLLSYGGRFII
uniref:Uncharacterized protein n=1 Tax=Salmonella sp. TaxID=599 RepID=A0A482ETJ3_SALSP|nr:hypothetical protein NNIBIDOC_00003 [Salmonella sp.]